MTQLALPGRIAVEVRQSPVKAIALGALFLVAACVWGPKFFRSGPTAPSAGTAATPADVAGAPVGPGAVPVTTADFTQRDPSSIRAEFIAISDEARALRRIAETHPAASIENDPFKALPRPVEQETPAAVATSAPVSEAAALDAVEQARARALVLSGVIVFGKGRAAIVDGVLVRTGERIAGLEVTSVEARRVELRGEHGTYVLTMDAKSPPPEGGAKDADKKEGP